MPAITVAQFRDFVFTWMYENGARAERVQLLDWGWEGWLQAELAGNLRAYDSTLDVRREQLVFDGKQRTDLMLNASSAVPGQRIIVELKTLRATEYNKPAFVKEIEADVDKLQYHLKATHKGAQLLVMAFYFDANAAIPAGFQSRQNIHKDLGICWKEMVIID
ncbi:hypothetical protein AB0Q95_38815 [Streptomyces sp. NPDC059900]|uniref:hypothetical protein n=1 Tax=Streptomyces sp. NPDC059900 TaxID=3155816 RepID=UPI003443AE05